MFDKRQFHYNRLLFWLSRSTRDGERTNVYYICSNVDMWFHYSNKLDWLHSLKFNTNTCLNTLISNHSRSNDIATSKPNKIGMSRLHTIPFSWIALETIHLRRDQKRISHPIKKPDEEIWATDEVRQVGKSNFNMADARQETESRTSFPTRLQSLVLFASSDKW